MPHYASDEIKPDLTVAAAWSCLRRCWRAYKIAINGRISDGREDERRVEYARRIVSLCKLLNIEPPYFSELDIEEVEEDNEEEMEEHVWEDNEYHSRQISQDKRGDYDDHKARVNEENYYYYNNCWGSVDQYSTQENLRIGRRQSRYYT
jgi:hypothetical protein